ncbi:bifunctional 2-polyprenyl-6-hydroxyphenol methylase/3-demethylubiquinol 3-O-methyltransferase UbiG [Streptomyces sp. ISL-100]|uniref:class I SAM-dependent methyltransferase n=1 Tax=Streptomyces sp. ISL-100 TaxID=2819173 RepID=UPI001BE67B6E|nr:class I SAM-dependent methyltransferase [Streptomyces sp. ISL-100]MBT2396070.1 class I SAM-dependent methyltransferase [Streptomyces sp. ISL-100]
MREQDAGAWDVWGASKAGRNERNAAGASTWFNWTQWPDHGPDEKILGNIVGSPVLDLGCGSGGNLAHLVALGADAVGVDISPVQIARTRERWPHLDVRQETAEEFLAADDYQYTAVCSVFGAAWFTDPADLLPLVHERLTPGGVYAFSHNPPALVGCYGPQASQMQPPEKGAEPLYVKRWDYEPARWAEMLKQAGFTDVTAEVIEPPAGKRTGTLLVRGVKGC